MVLNINNKSAPEPRIFGGTGSDSGSCSCCPSPTSHRMDPSNLDEYDRFALIFLSQEQVARYPPMPHLSMRTSPPVWLVDPITKLFEANLLSRHPKDDRWSTGSTEFAKSVRYYVSRAVPIQFCLPAFPCKSTNPRKTSGSAPDAAEYEALANLHQFCLRLHEIYDPGAEFVIVSDGHVFSDCIGVDDGDVYKYTDAVKAVSDKIHASLHMDEPSLPFDSPVRFVSLRDIFHPSGSDLLDQVPEIDLKDCAIYRPLNTKIDPEDEKSRKMMMRSCAFEQSMLDKMIEDNPDGSLTSTFRGFKKFMEHDLEALETYKNLSHNQRKFIAYKVAKTMIHRNQAYSHLVELVFPRAIRLSIHQHNNQGPKFAVNLLPNNKFRKIQSLKPTALRSAVLTDHAVDTKIEDAHIPTPWHNVLVEVEGEEMVYVCEAGVVKDELMDPFSPYNRKTSGWDEKSGRYELRY